MKELSFNCIEYSYVCIQLPKGCGPRAIVVTPYWPSGDIAARLFQQLSSQLTVIQTYGGGAELEKKVLNER